MEHFIKILFGKQLKKYSSRFIVIVYILNGFVNKRKESFTIVIKIYSECIRQSTILILYLYLFEYVLSTLKLYQRE